MPRSYRLAIIALGLTLLLGGQAEPDQPEASTGEATTQEQWPPLPLPVQVVEEQAEKEARERIEQEAREREIDDVAAQRGMNEASQRMADAAEVQTWIVGFGTFLLFVTLFLTWQANCAARAAVQVTRIVGEAQVRAYLTCEGAEYSVSTGALMCKMKMRNHGLSPANRCTVKAYADGMVRVGDERKFIRSEETEGWGPAIPAEGVGDITMSWNKEHVGGALFNHILNGGEFDITCKVEWVDVFEKKVPMVVLLEPTEKLERSARFYKAARSGTMGPTNSDEKGYPYEYSDARNAKEPGPLRRTFERLTSLLD